MGTLHSDEVTAPREPKGSLVAPLIRKMSRTSKFVSTPALASSLQKTEGEFNYCKHIPHPSIRKRHIDTCMLKNRLPLLFFILFQINQT